MKFSNLKGLLLAVVYSISTIAISKEPIAHDRNSHEIVGRFFQCVGRCRVDRGLNFFNPSFSTAIYEGDEVQTIGESFAWIFLLDGTMVRLSPESSINFNVSFINIFLFIFISQE